MKKTLLLLLCLIVFSSCATTASPTYAIKSDYLLGTLVSVKIYDFGETDKSVIDDCFSIIKKYEQIFSYNDPNSELSALNKAAFNNHVKVSDELFDIVFKSLSYCKKTNGAFDIGLGKLIEIWDKATILETPPDFKDISDFIGFKAFEHIVISEIDKTVMYTDERVSIHLGACAKGYLEDIALLFLKEKGVKSAILDFGGSITALGDKTGEPFHIGISDPVNDNELVGEIMISDKSVVTSGDYRRYFMYEEIKYHHILDSNTAYPASSDINGVSVICDSAFIGDCLSTASYVLGSEKGIELLLSEECGYVIVDKNSVKYDGVVFIDEG